MKTGMIKFNIRDRGRFHRGQPRNLDTKALAAIINGPEVQERVKNGDLKGYYGHWPRMRFGMDPPEGAIVDGKPVLLESGLKTTMLRADDDGNIEFEAEIRSNLPGKTISEMIMDKVGGFSSAINAKLINGVHVPISFHGFDYVDEPNYTKNRPYSLLDAVEGEGESDDIQPVFDMIQGSSDLQAVFDEVAAGYTSALEHLRQLYDSVCADHLRALEAIERLQIENNDYVGRIAASAQPVLDSVEFERPTRVTVMDSAESVKSKMESFRTEPLPPLEPLPSAETPETKAVRSARANALEQIGR